MRFHTCLEEIQGGGSRSVGRHILSGSILDDRHLTDERNHVAQELHQTAHTHVLSCTNAEHRIDAACDETFADTLAHFIFCQIFRLEEFLHQRVVTGCCCLHQGGFHLFGLVELLCRNILDDRSAAFGLPGIFLHQQHIDHGIEAGTCSDRILNGNTVRAIDLLQLVQDGIEITVLTVELVHEEDHGFLQFLSIAERIHRTYLRTVLAIHEDHGLIRHVQGGDGTTHEVVRSRTVDDVQFLVVPLNMKNSGEHAIAIFLLHREIIAHGVLLLHRAAALDHSAFE